MRAQVIRPFQLRLRNPSSPEGYGINLMAKASHDVLTPRLKFDETTALTVTTATPLKDFIATRQEINEGKSVVSHYGVIGSSKLTSFSAKKIDDALRRIFMGENISVSGVVLVDSDSVIEESSLISGTIPMSPPIEGAVLIESSRIGSGVSVLACDVVDSILEGDPYYNAAENNPFSIFQASKLKVSSFSGRFEVTSSKIRGLQMINRSLVPKTLDFKDLSLETEGRDTLVFNEEKVLEGPPLA